MLKFLFLPYSLILNLKLCLFPQHQENFFFVILKHIIKTKLIVKELCKKFLSSVI